MIGIKEMISRFSLYIPKKDRHDEVDRLIKLQNRRIDRKINKMLREAGIEIPKDNDHGKN